MKHSTTELFDIIYRFYPRMRWSEHPEHGWWPVLVHPPVLSPEDRARPFQSWPPPGYDDTEEHRRLVAARKAAGARMEVWRAFVRHLNSRFPEPIVETRCLHLPTGNYDGCYSAWLRLLARKRGEYRYGLGILVSFLAPYYLIHSESAVRTRERGKSELFETFSFFPEGELKPYVSVIAEEIGAVFPDHEPMPPEIGTTRVPGVASHLRFMDRSTIYDCLFTRLGGDPGLGDLFPDGKPKPPDTST